MKHLLLKNNKILYFAGILLLFFVSIVFSKILMVSYARAIIFALMPLLAYIIIKNQWLYPVIIVAVTTFFPSSAFKAAIFYVGGLKIRFNEILLLVFLLYILYTQYKKSRTVKIKHENNDFKTTNILFIALFTTFLFNSMLSAIKIAVSIEAIVIFAINTFGAFLVGYYCAEEKKHVNKIFACFLAIATVVSLIGIWEIVNQKYFYYYYFNIFPMVKIYESYTVQRAASTFLNSNPYGAYLAMFVPVALSFYLKAGKHRFIYLIAGLIIFLGAIISFSRGALLSVAGGLIIISIKMHKVKVLVKIATAIFIMLFIANLYMPIYKTFNERLTRESTFQSIDLLHRALSYKTAFNVLQEAPFTGIGFGQSKNIFTTMKDPRAENIGTLDNIYLKVFIETGIIGVLIFISIIAYVFIVPWNRKLPGNLKQKGFKINMGIWTGLVIIFLCGFTFDTFSWASISVPFFLVLGIMIKSVHMEWNSEQNQ